MKRNILYAAILGAISPLSVVPEGEGAISPETLAAIPADVKNDAVPAGRNWNQAGQDFASKVIGAEQGILVATESLSATKKEGLKECAHLDEIGRAQFIAGCLAGFAAADGDKLLKGHNNYMADLRRVSNAVKLNSLQYVLEKLSAVGTYAAIMETIPRVSAAGGQNKGTGVQATVAAVKEALASGKEVIIADTAPGGAAGLSKVPPQHTEVQSDVPPVGRMLSDDARKSLEKLLTAIGDDQIPGIAMSFANRCKTAKSPLWNELGSVIVDFVQDAVEIKKPEGEHAPIIAHDSQPAQQQAAM